MRRIAIIDVGSGNLYSVEKAVRHVADAQTQVALCSNADELQAATHVILPGVGAFADCMKGLANLAGMREALERKVLQEKTPFLGICVGMQMLFERSHEHGETQGLGWIKGEVLSLASIDSSLRIPHMGWNELEIEQEHPLVDGVANGDHAYFVHSYHCVPQEKVTTISVDYGGKVVAAIAKDNLFATQFHPEKSQKTGLRLIQNFLQHSYGN